MAFSRPGAAHAAPTKKPSALLVVLSVVAAFALLGLGISMWWLGTPDVPQAAPAGTDTDEPTDEAVDDTDPTAEPVGLVVDGVDVVLSHDPFTPVVQTSASSGGDASGGDTDTDTDTDSDADPDDDVDPTPSPTPARGCEADAKGEVVCDGRVVALGGLEKREGRVYAAIQVGTTVYEVTAGQSFADAFVLMSIDDPCVSVLHEDGIIRLCLDARVLK